MLSKIRKRGILGAAEECLLAVTALNLKRMANAIFFYMANYVAGSVAIRPQFPVKIPFLTGLFVDTTELSGTGHFLRINIDRLPSTNGCLAFPGYLGIEKKYEASHLIP